MTKKGKRDAMQPLVKESTLTEYLTKKKIKRKSLDISQVALQFYDTEHFSFKIKSGKTLMEMILNGLAAHKDAAMLIKEILPKK